MHHGVKGMKWGVRHDPVRSGRSFRGNAHRAYSKVFALNEATYRRMGNKTLASMNAAAKNEQLRKAEAADHRVQNRKVEKNEKYRQKLISKAEKKAGEAKREARDLKNEIDDINKMGNKSAYWKQHARSEADSYARKVTERNKRAGYSDRDAEFWGKMSGGAKYLQLSNDYSGTHRNTYVKSLTETRSDAIRVAKQYTKNKQSLMNYKVGNTTKKRDIRKVYRNGLTFGE